ncbi:MAG: dTDP-glucose 4,6-dehydratase [Ignavibacteria bacterium]|nr:dTDP-glucose 4,6-dehydratase [Ignavibacteria bacterium]
MKVLITGGAGFIFSRVAEFCLNAGYEVVIVDKLTYAGDLARINHIYDRIKFYKADVCNQKDVFDVFEREKPQIVIHSAAETHVDRSILDGKPFLESNVIGTYVLLEAARRYNTEKFINITTDEVYGELGGEGHFQETSPLRPNSPYAVSKTSADMLGRSYLRTYQLPVITVRPSNNYGMFQYPEKLIPVVFLKAYNNEKIPVYGKGENVREWLFVDDTARAMLKIIENGKIGEIYNVGSSEERRNIDVVRKILDIMGKSDELIEFVKDRPGHDFRYSLSCDKIKQELGWQAEVGFEEGLRRTIEWYFNNIDWLLNKIEQLRKYWELAYKQ